MVDRTLETTLPPRKVRSFSLYDQQVQGIIWQIVILGTVLAVGYYLFANMQHNLQVRRIQTGWDFLTRESGFAIGEHLIAYSPASSYGRAIIVGLLNTLLVAVIGIVLATIIGVFIGIATLSRNWLVAKLTEWYIHILRNIPVLLQIIFWYAIFINDRFTQSAQPRSNPSGTVEPVFGDIYITNGGIFMPRAIDPLFWPSIGWGLAAAFALSIALGSYADRRQRLTGQRLPTGLIRLGLFIAGPLIAWLIAGAPWAWEAPSANRFRLAGGANITPEFIALLVGLTVYTSAFIGEIVRSGILAVPKGQTEAGRALGLRDSVIMRQVILPQALRVIIPPTTSQYLNLTKNSSLAVAIGYPDLVSIGNTTINQTGQAPEGVLILMIVYLTISILTSVGMNLYNARIQLVER
ncbi:MAG: amino acid ABC transporter permease [Hyphomicrobiaceae bacterium]